MPLEALGELEGRDDSTLAFDTVTPDRTVVRWSERGIPQTRNFAVPKIESILPFPALPEAWAEVPADLIEALAESTATSAEDDTRYALSCLLLKAGRDGHEVIATDGRQVLIRSGFNFPWTGDVLIRRSPIFASGELSRDRPGSIGRTETHLALRSGPWTILSEIPTAARFPRVDMAFPAPEATTARLRLDPADATFLADALGRLPGAETDHAPVTVDLNGRVTVRARASESEATTELVLSRSAYTGTPVRFATNRYFLARAVRLGFAEVEVVAPDSPIVCRASHRAYAWQPLEVGSAIGPAEGTTRIESHLPPPATCPPRSQPRTNLPMKHHIEPEGSTSRVGHATSDHAEVTSDLGATGLVALIREAESLHEALGEARGRSQKLIVALKRQRKQARLMTATLATLRQLELPKVAR